MKILDFLVRRDDRVVDVGGNRGIYAYQFWRLGARVEVFEPNPTCFGVLAAWALDKPAVNLHSVALSGRSGSATLHVPITEAGIEQDASGSIEYAAVGRVRDQSVSLETLDSYGFDALTLIKIDVEGHEYNVIEGASATLARSAPALLVEIEQRHNTRPIAAVFQKIERYGYQGFYMGVNGLSPFRNLDFSFAEPKGKHGRRRARYINNFLFLHQRRLDEGEYRELLDVRSFQ